MEFPLPTTQFNTKNKQFTDIQKMRRKAEPAISDVLNPICYKSLNTFCEK